MLRRTLNVKIMEKYIYLILSMITTATAIALGIYGVCTDHLYLCGEGFIYMMIGLFLLSNYKESKERESNGI